MTRVPAREGGGPRLWKLFERGLDENGGSESYAKPSGLNPENWAPLLPELLNEKLDGEACNPLKEKGPPGKVAAVTLPLVVLNAPRDVGLLKLTPPSGKSPLKPENWAPLFPVLPVEKIDGEEVRPPKLRLLVLAVLPANGKSPLKPENWAPLFPKLPVEKIDGEGVVTKLPFVVPIVPFPRKLFASRLLPRVPTVVPKPNGLNPVVDVTGVCSTVGSWEATPVVVNGKLVLSCPTLGVNAGRLLKTERPDVSEGKEVSPEKFAADDVIGENAEGVNSDGVETTGLVELKTGLMPVNRPFPVKLPKALAPLATPLRALGTPIVLKPVELKTPALVGEPKKEVITGVTRSSSPSIAGLSARAERFSFMDALLK